MSETLQDKLRAMAEECVAGQRTSKSNRWAHTLVAAADALDAQAQRIAALTARVEQAERNSHDLDAIQWRELYEDEREQHKRVRDEANALTARVEQEKNRADTNFDYLTARVEVLWQPIETADREALLLLWTPPERLYTDPTSGGPDIRVSTPHNWTWATHWMPLPAPPDVAPAPREGTEADRKEQ